MTARRVGGSVFGLMALVAGASAVGGYIIHGATRPSEPSGVQMITTSLAQPGDDTWEAFAKLNQPGPHHKHLEVFVGSWRAEVKHWMPGHTEPSVSTGTVTTRWVHDGRFLLSDYTGTFSMNPEAGPQPFTGTAIQGYNTITGEYENVWIDNMGTAVHVNKGTFDQSTRTFTENSECAYPGEDGTPIRVAGRGVTRILSNDTYVSTMYQTMPGQPETKVMEITFTRRR